MKIKLDEERTNSGPTYQGTTQWTCMYSKQVKEEDCIFHGRQGLAFDSTGWSMVCVELVACCKYE